MRPARGVIVGALAILLLVGAAAASAELATPRATVLAFLAAARAGDWERAADTLDLSAIPASNRAARGPELARQLAVVLDRTLALDPESLSDVPEGDRDDGLPAASERIGVVERRQGRVTLLLRRSSDSEGRWRFAAGTVALVPSLYAEFGPGALEALLPRPLLDIRLLGIALWQWIGLLLLAVVAWAVSWLITALLNPVARRLVARSATTVDDDLTTALTSPVRWALALVAFTLGALALPLDLLVAQFLAGLEKASAVLVVAWALVRAVDVVAGVAASRLAARGRTAAVAVVPLGSKTIKVLVLGFAVIAMLQNIGMNVTGLLAGLGIGGLAVALAGQKTIENLFGGVALITDQPVRVGDFCRFGERVGTIEDIGLRSTRIRTLDRTIVSVPNAEFSALQLENFAARDRIWLQATIGLRYETTPDQLRYALVEIRKLLYAHPRVDAEPARIRFVGFGAYSLDCEIFAYVLTADYGEFLAIREDILLRIMEVVAASGTSFAFPSQTLYVGHDTGLDESAARTAETQVQAWRAQGAMSLPDFAPEEIAAIRGTLDYPPVGAATGHRR